MTRRSELRELTRVRILTFLREPEALFWVFVFPLVLAAVLGFAFREGSLEPTPIGIIAERPGDATSEAATDALTLVLARDELLSIERFASFEDARKQLTKAAIDVLVIPGAPPTLELEPNKSEAEIARVRILRALELEASGGAEADVRIAPVTEKGSRYLDFLFPGLLGMNLMGTGMWGVGFAIADVRRRKFLKRLLVTPMRRSSFFLSFMLSRLVFLILELLVIVLIGTLLLDVPFRCNVFDFGVLSAVGAFTFAGLGILVASRAKTIEGVSGMMNLVMMPMWLGSGVFFSYERFPDGLQPVLKLLPLTGLNDALRAMMLDGDGLAAVGPELLVQVAWGALSFAVALKIFRWQ